MQVFFENDELALKGIMRTERISLHDVVRMQVMADTDSKIQREPFKLWDVPFLRFVMLGSEDSTLTLDCYDKGFEQAVSRLERDGWKIAEATLRSYAHPLVREDVERDSAGSAHASARSLET